MPSSTVSGTTIRSISVETTGNAEKFVKYTAKYRITKTIDYQLGHRKDKPLIGILETETEEPKSASDSDSEADDEIGSTETPKRLTEEGDGEEGDGILVEGLTESTPHSVAPATPDPEQSEKLIDIFG